MYYFSALSFQVRRIYQDASIGNAIDVSVVKMIILKKPQVTALSRKPNLCHLDLITLSRHLKSLMKLDDYFPFRMHSSEFSFI